VVRIAVVDKERCNPRDCSRECQRFCPMVRSKVEAVKFGDDGKAVIVESLCTGCAICIKKCPFRSLEIVNLPAAIEGECSHRYGVNGFELYRLPVPREGFVTGLIGKNGIGKTTAIKILSGELVPNLGLVDKTVGWGDVIMHYRGTIIYEYLLKLSRKSLRVSHKPQYLESLAKEDTSVSAMLNEIERSRKGVIEKLELDRIAKRKISNLSGGELQRLAIAMAYSKEADIYLFDEPSSYLDVKQRLKASKLIRNLKDEGKMIVVVEHDLAVLDYLSDQIFLLYGSPGVYGVVSHPHGVRVGINIYLQGYIPDDNVRFRNESIIFPVHPPTGVVKSPNISFSWDALEKHYRGFRLHVLPGEVRKGEITGILGPNGIGKTTFVKLIAGLEKPTKGEVAHKLKVSYKPQYPTPTFEGTVKELLDMVLKDTSDSSWFEAEVIRAFKLDRLLDRRIPELSGGEVQKAAICACLARKADIYLLDEPSAHLDVEERLAMGKAIRRIVESREVSAFVVEHDIVAEDFIADKLMIFTGDPSVSGTANVPTSLREGMNSFLKDMDITFRRDPETKRPRVNKEDSSLDKHQKEIGEYYFAYD